MKFKIIFAHLVVILGVTCAQECASDEFKCDNDKCIPDYWVCDGYDDCGDSSDEPTDPRDCPACGEGQWQCDNGRCTYEDFVCDGDNDCGDASDEQQDCPPCGDDRFQCANGVCVAPIAICNNWDECGDNSDEADENGKCPDCPAGAFTCPNSNHCIPKSYTCDGDNDCGDWSDETEDACPCSDDEIRCSRQSEDGPPGACIPTDWICDEEGIWDCPNGEDEANCTLTNRAPKNTRIHRIHALKFKSKTVAKKSQKFGRKMQNRQSRPKYWYKP